MKIVCDSCGAKYSIADEKVQGKVFKIRCKKCSNVIVVKGSAEDASAVEGSGAAEWYVVLDGEQVGPVTTAEIDAYFMAGQVTADTYGWKDGMDNWLHLADIATFSHLVQETAGPNEATQIADSARYGQDVDSTNVVNSPLSMGSDAGFSDPYPSDPSYGEDDYGSGYDGGYAGFAGGYDAGYDAGGMGGELAAAAPDDGGGMFAAFDSGGDSDFMSFGDGAPAAAAVPTSSIGDGLVGQRNENSVLFSLSSLDSVSAVGPKDTPVTEGSGLIDIQALASAHKSMSGGGGDEASVDPFAHGTMAMPALMPMGSHRNNTALYGAIGVAALMVIVMIGVVVWVVTRDEPEPREVIREVHTVEKVVEATRSPERADSEAAEAELAAAAAAAAAPKKVEEDEASSDDNKSPSKTTKRPKVATKSPAKADPEPEPKRPSPPAKKKDSIDSILDKIDQEADKTTQKKATAAASSSSEKSELGRDDVKNTINRYNSRINTCARSQNSAGKTGTIDVGFQIRPNGRVHGVKILSSGFKGTDVGRCVEAVVGSMTFPKTSATKDVEVKKYPFIIK